MASFIVVDQEYLVAGSIGMKPNDCPWSRDRLSSGRRLAGAEKYASSRFVLFFRLCRSCGLSLWVRSGCGMFPKPVWGLGLIPLPFRRWSWSGLLVVAYFYFIYFIYFFRFARAHMPFFSVIDAFSRIGLIVRG